MLIGFNNPERKPPPAQRQFKVNMPTFSDMIDVYVKLSPLVFSYLLGIALRRTGVLKKDDGGILLRIVFYVALPSLMLLSVPEAELKRDFLVLPLVAVAIILVTYLIAYFVFRRVRGEPTVFGVSCRLKLSQACVPQPSAEFPPAGFMAKPSTLNEVLAMAAGGM